MSAMISTGVLRERRNLLRFTGTPLRLVLWSGVEQTESEPPSLVEVDEGSFDEYDITMLGRPSQFCVLASGLCAVWPTADRDYDVSMTVAVAI